MVKRAFEGLRPSFSAHVRWGEQAPVRFPSAFSTAQTSRLILAVETLPIASGLYNRYFCCSFWAAIWPAAVLEVFSWA